MGTAIRKMPEIKRRRISMKTELGISTDFAGESGRLEEIEETLRKISEAGFTHIHWCHEWDGDYIYSPYEMLQIREWMDRYGLKAKGVHASKGSVRNVNVQCGHSRRDYTSDWEYNRKAGVDLIKNRVDLAQCLGAEEIVLHLYCPHLSMRTDPQLKDRYYAQVKRSFDELQPYCMEKGVKICIENLFDIPEKYVLGQWDWLLKEYPPEYMGICLDAGHGYMVWRERLPELIRKYRGRIYAVHLHDNIGSVDFHLLPGDGQMDWKKVMQELAGSAYQLPLVLEVNSCEESAEEFLKRAFAAGERLQGYYEDALKK